MGVKVSIKKRNGVYYTPNELAEFLVEPLLKQKGIKIFDPSYGKGSLLLAADKIYKEKYGESDSCQLHGCDIIPKNGYLKHLPNENFIKDNFFNIDFEFKADLILMNPPYVRHHLITTHKQEKYKKTIIDYLNPTLTSDLWVYFLIKSIKHLNKNGAIGAILPWSFLQADYAVEVRKILPKYFSKIKVLALGSDYFFRINERIVMLWLEGYGKTCSNINIYFSKHIEKNINYNSLVISNWTNKRVITSKNNDIGSIVNFYKSKGYIKFKEIAKIRIGVVTGADKFFIISKKDSKLLKIDLRHTQPILRGSKEITALSSLDLVIKNHILKLSTKNKKKYAGYLAKGRKEKYHLRAHAKLRDPWFIINTGEYPDGFFPYRSSNYPFLCLNSRKLQCTNSIHRVYFIKNLSVKQKIIIQLSFLTYVTQLSLECNSKVYGSGVLKIEPNSLYNTIVYSENNIEVESIYNEANDLIKNNLKDNAVELVSNFFDDQLKIPNDIRKKARETYLELATRRHDRHT